MPLEGLLRPNPIQMLPTGKAGAWYKLFKVQPNGHAMTIISSGTYLDKDMFTIILNIDAKNRNYGTKAYFLDVNRPAEKVKYIKDDTGITIFIHSISYNESSYLFLAKKDVEIYNELIEEGIPNSAIDMAL